MKRRFVMLLAGLLALWGCTPGGQILDGDGMELSEEEADAYAQLREKWNAGTVSGDQNVTVQSDDPGEASGASGNLYRYYAPGDAFCLLQDYSEMTSVIIDGDTEIPVDIAMGIYGPYFDKCDIDGDGEDEYIIAECEATGTGCSVYGLCIVEKTASGYETVKYEGDHFSSIIEERVTYEYDAASHEVTFCIMDENVPSYTVKLNRDADLESIVFSDIVRVYIIDGKVYLSVSAGYIFRDEPVPVYEDAVEISASIEIRPDHTIVVGGFTFNEDTGEKSPSEVCYRHLEIE